MHNDYVPAIFESGMLRPLAPLDLREHEQVDIAIVRATSTIEESDESYAAVIVTEADDEVTLEQVQRALAKIPGSLVEDFVRHRDERF